MTITVTVPSVFTPVVRSLSWVNRKKGEWVCLYQPEQCRSRLIDYWYRVNKNSSYGIKVTNFNGEIPDIDKTAIFFYGDFLKQVEKNILLLNKLEEQHGIALTTFLAASNGIIFIGDKKWQSTMWKISLYSFYLKALVCSEWVKGTYDLNEYYSILKSHEQTLLGKVVTEDKETVTGTDYTSIHSNTGFVEICRGKNNKPMTKLLLGEVK